MKKKLLLILVMLGCFILVGCGKNGAKDVINKLSKKVNNTNGYHLVGTLQIQNNEDTYTYDVDVAYKKTNNFRVSLKNKTNNHEQIILRNSDGVYVLTPSLNKSFKFQSEWPYNNSQSYLLQTLIKDIKNDPNRIFKETDNNYIFTTKVNYSNNKNLVKQTIYFDKDLNIVAVNVMNNEDQVLMKVEFSDVDMNATYNDDYFSLKGNMEASSEVKTEEPASKIEEVIYPMYIPVNTFLKSQDKVAKTGGERIILTFDGEKPFMLVQETVSIDDEMVTTLCNGEPYILSDTIGAVTDSSATWVSNGIEYYLASDALTQEELLEVANSISVMPVGK